MCGLEGRAYYSQIQRISVSAVRRLDMPPDHHLDLPPQDQRQHVYFSQDLFRPEVQLPPSRKGTVVHY